MFYPHLKDTHKHYSERSCDSFLSLFFNMNHCGETNFVKKWTKSHSDQNYLLPAYVLNVYNLKLSKSQKNSSST